ncbi:hypothetical protein LIER_17498 [Lithospermum erythrorhizon]|uniref:Uncharacterized protein n=1 Tax=Lithospermum erythrorhizon TaxID=34254 RepID=A0AAV3QCX2_LITER
MAVYLKGGSHYPEDGPFTKSVTPPNAVLSNDRKCKSVAYDLYDESILADQEEAKENGSDKLIENLSWWRKSEVDLMSKAPEMLLKEEASQHLGAKDDSVGSNIFSGVKKSSSTPSVQDAENSTLSSSSWLNGTWSLKPEPQALPTSSITKPILDGLPLPIPITGKKSKAAID